jgi:3-hydroxyisobutyrate dehydrogenase-like beta-hydroxyacid dehydrogenase
MAEIGFLGLGRMGRGMAGRLLGAGHRLRVWNRSAVKAHDLVAAGARLGQTPADAARGADAVFAMVADDIASEAVWNGPQGALEVMSRGALVIESSTLSTSHVANLARAASARGLAYLDCPVAGLPPAAAAGELTLLVGGTPETLERARPLLTPLCRAIRHFGPVGTGTAFKLINNMLGAVQIASLAEAMALAQKLGLDPETVAEATENGAVASPQVKRHARRMLQSQFSDGATFTVGLRLKDVRYCLAMAEGANSAMPIAQDAADWYADAANANFDGDEARLVEAVTRRK